jgi:hypothetical protein
MESSWYLDGWHIGYVDVINEPLNIHPTLFEIRNRTPFLSGRMPKALIDPVHTPEFFCDHNRNRDFIICGTCMQSRSVPTAPFTISVVYAPAISDVLLPVLIAVHDLNEMRRDHYAL